MKTFLPLALAALFFAQSSYADVISGPIKPYASCRGYDSESLTLWDTAAVTYKQGVLVLNGQTIQLHCTRTEMDPSAPIHPDQAEQFYSCVEVDGGPFKVSIQTFGILPAVVGYISNEADVFTVVGCPDFNN